MPPDCRNVAGDLPEVGRERAGPHPDDRLRTRLVDGGGQTLAIFGDGVSEPARISAVGETLRLW